MSNDRPGSTAPARWSGGLMSDARVGYRRDMMMTNKESDMRYLGIGEIAAQLGVSPRLVSDVLYQRRVDLTGCLLVAGRRLVPTALVPQIADALREAGRLEPAKPSCA